MGDRLVFQSPIFKIQKCEYIAHACLVTNYEDAKDVMAHISLGYYSANCAPYAILLKEDYHEYSEIYEDLGEFLAGNTLMSVLKSYENIYKSAEVCVLVMITRKIYGCFVTDMIQNMKYNAIRTCANKALIKLNKKMFQSRSKESVRQQQQPETTITIPNPSLNMTATTSAIDNDNTINKKDKRKVLPTSSINFNPDSFGIPAIPQPKSKEERNQYRPGHFKDSLK